MEEYVRDLLEKGVHQTRVSAMVKNAYPKSNRAVRNRTIQKVVKERAEHKRLAIDKPKLQATAKEISRPGMPVGDLVRALKQAHPLTSRKLRKSVAYAELH